MSFAQPRQPLRRGMVPLAGMLDVLFLLLIFFATTSTFHAAEQEVDVQLPVAESGSPASPQRSELLINVTEAGRILIAGKAYELDTLYETLRQIVADYPDERVVIRGDQHVDYGRVVAVMDAARSANVRRIYFATVKPAEQVGG